MKFLVILATILGVSAAHAETYTQDQVRKIFEQEYANRCSDFSRGKELQMDEAHDFTVEETKYQIFTFVCDVAAYNATAVHYLADQYTAPHAISLVVPSASYDEKTKTATITGFYADTVNPYGSFDPATLTIHTHYKGRGIGDAFETGTYKFENREFMLKKYIVDLTFDQEINPITIIDYK